VADAAVRVEVLFSKVLETTSMSSDVLATVSDFFRENGFCWETLVGICTDGAPVMLGLGSGFMTMIK
jgi:hypothetical protein